MIRIGLKRNSIHLMLYFEYPFISARCEGVYHSMIMTMNEESFEGLKKYLLSKGIDTFKSLTKLNNSDSAIQQCDYSLYIIPKDYGHTKST